MTIGENGNGSASLPGGKKPKETYAVASAAMRKIGNEEIWKAQDVAKMQADAELEVLT